MLEKISMKAAYVLFFLAVTLAIETTTPGKKVLAILENDELKSSHSLFFENLKNKGCDIEYVKTDDSFEISKFGVFGYDHIILMMESDKKYSSLNFKEFRSFLDFHGDVFVMFGNSPNDFVRKLAGYNGIEIDAAGSTVVDHFNAVPGSDNIYHTKFTTSAYPKIARMVGDLASRTGSILYRGTGMRVSSDNALVVPVLTGDIATTSLSSTNTPLGYSKDVVLMAASQTRTNNRFVIVGSLDMFSNQYYNENGDNQILGNQISLWAFKFYGYLRVSNIEHYKYIREEDRIEKEHEILVQEVKKPNLPTSHYPEPEVAGNNVVYRIKQELYYSVNIQEYNGEEWVPYEADDVQLEFVMLDPYIRKTMTYEKEKNNGDYSTIIRAPDVYGIYKFRLFYQRQGLSLINENTQVSIRPFKHNEYPRFILAAYPYYISAIVMMIGFVVFVYIFLFAGEKQKQD